MRRGLFAIWIALAAAGVASADDNIGCGLGTQVWEGSEGLAPKVLGATTNGTFGNQTFGITTGTLGCKAEGVITADARLQMFASANLDNLARDMARGNGETLATFAHLMEIDEADQPVFYAFTRQHFAEIFARSDMTAGDMLVTLDQLLATDPKLSVYARS
jgi:hypothetical protein